MASGFDSWNADVHLRLGHGCLPSINASNSRKPIVLQTDFQTCQLYVDETMQTVSGTLAGNAAAEVTDDETSFLDSAHDNVACQ